MLEVRDLEVFYGSSYIIQKLSLKVAPGQSVALLGRNGAGKSTTIKGIMNLDGKVRGSIRFKGENILGKPPYQLARKGLGYVPEDRRMFSSLSVMDNLKIGLYGTAKDVQPYSIDEMLELFPIMKNFKYRKAGMLSGGEQQVVTIARTLMAKPEIILLDEPTEGLAPIIVTSLMNVIKKIVHELGVGVLLAEQNINFCRKLTEYVYLIDQGRLIFEGSWKEFDQHPSLKERYLAV